MTDPLGARPPRPAPSGLLLEAAIVVPDVIISSLLWLVIFAALPTTVGFAVTVVGIAVGALLVAGLGEDTVVCVLYRPAARPRPRRHGWPSRGGWPPTTWTPTASGFGS